MNEDRRRAKSPEPDRSDDDRFKIWVILVSWGKPMIRTKNPDSDRSEIDRLDNQINSVFLRRIGEKQRA